GHGLLQQRLLAGERMELLREKLARQRPQSRTGSTGHDYGQEHGLSFSCFADSSVTAAVNDQMESSMTLGLQVCNYTLGCGVQPIAIDRNFTASVSTKEERRAETGLSQGYAPSVRPLSLLGWCRSDVQCCNVHL